MALTAQVEAKVKGTLSNSSTGASDSFSLVAGKSLANGTGADQASREWESTGRSILSAASENIDMYDLGSIDIGAGAGLDALGQSFALTGIKVLYVKNSADSAGSLVVGGDGTTAAWNSMFNSDDDAVIILQPGAFFLICVPSAAGLAVADTSNHLLKMAASGGNVTYDVGFIGI